LRDKQLSDNDVEIMRLFSFSVSYMEKIYNKTALSTLITADDCIDGLRKIIDGHKRYIGNNQDLEKKEYIFNRLKKHIKWHIDRYVVIISKKEYLR